MQYRIGIFLVFMLLPGLVQAQGRRAQRLEGWFAEGNYEKVIEKGERWAERNPEQGAVPAWVARAYGIQCERAPARQQAHYLIAALEAWRQALAWGNVAVLNQHLQFSLWLQYTVREAAVMAYQEERMPQARYYTAYLADQLGDTLTFAAQLLHWTHTPTRVVVVNDPTPIDPAHLPAWARNPQNPITLPQYVACRDSILAVAERQKGTPYLWAGESPSGFDCSGFVLYVMRSQGYEFYHGTRFVKELGNLTDESKVEPGDLVFFGNPSSTNPDNVTHMGIIYRTGAGQRQVIHCTNRGVVIDDLNDGNYWTERILFFRDIVDVAADE